MRSGARLHSRWARLLAVLGALTMLAAACGGGGKSSSNGGTTGTTSAPSTPKAGGSLTIATEAEVTTGFDPFNSDWDATGLSYALTVFDSLTTLGADGNWRPLLAESVTPSTDYKSWTIKARPGITFTDGEPFNADAMKLQFDTELKSPLLSPPLNDVAGVAKVDDLSVRIDMKVPWVAFPYLLAGQFGMMVAPKSVADTGRAQHPIGTGPFIFQSWVPGDHFTATKNPHYWRKDQYGNQLPYLDSVTFKPIVDATSRENSLKAGTVDLIHTTNPQTIVDFRGDKSVQLLEQTKGRTEINFMMINTSSPPLDDVRIRMALAYGLDRNRYIQIHDNGILKVADGPFSDGSGFTNAPGYPAYDPAKAKQLVQQYEADHHTNKVEIELGNTNDARSLQQSNLLADMWNQIGITSHVVQVEQSAYILNALLGKYQVYGWRQFSEPDPDADFIWWGSSYTTPPLATNFARNKDPLIDQYMTDARSSSDPAKRKQDYTNVSAQFNKDIPYLWLDQTLWAYAAKPNVVITGGTLPDGSPSKPVWSGVFGAGQYWINK